MHVFPEFLPHVHLFIQLARVSLELKLCALHGATLTLGLSVVDAAVGCRDTSGRHATLGYIAAMLRLPFMVHEVSQARACLIVEATALARVSA